VPAARQRDDGAGTMTLWPRHPSVLLLRLRVRLCLGSRSLCASGAHADPDQLGDPRRDLGTLIRVSVSGSRSPC